MNSKNIFSKLSEAINSHDVKTIASLYADNAVVYDPFYPEPLKGRAAIEKDTAANLHGFPDMHFEVQSSLADENTAAAQIIMSGTNSGPMETPDGEIPPTGKKIEIAVASFNRLDNEGKIVEEHRYYNVANVMDQLGLTQ
jgi:steroid delta-isomerase-like uncharacterized protein